MTFVRHLCATAAFATLAVGPLAGCDKAKSSLQTAAGNMTFTGTVSRAGTTTPIKGANVVLIALATPDAIKSLMEVKKIPDGKGGQADRLRIKLEQVQAYLKTHDAVRTTTDDKGKFTTQAPIQVYLVYTFGPGGEPGSSAQAFTGHFWGINPDTGEIDKDHLIGVDLKLTQNNDKIQLSGGPVPPAPPPAATPQPKATVVVPPPPPTPAPPVAPEPKPGDTTLPRGNVVPPTPSAFWTSIKLNYNGGFIGTGGNLQVDTAPLPDGQRYLELDAELAAEQATPAYLVLQKGIDSTSVAGCDGTLSAATVRVYPVTVNGTHVVYQLVPPGPYYKLYLAKTATQAKDGEAPASPDSPSDTLTVGTRTCANAVPERPFLATLTWDQQADIDLHVLKFDAAKILAATDADAIGAALVDQANYMSRQGTTLSLDVDNTYAYGPENNGDSKDELHPENFCYMVKVNYYSGSAPVVKASVDVTYLAPENGKKVVKQVPSQVVLNASGDWRTIGAYGPTQCQKLLNPPPAPSDVMPYPPAADCTNPASCDLKGDTPDKYKATITMDKASFAASEAIKVTYAGMPDVSGNWVTIVPKGQVDNSYCSWSWVSGATGTQYYGSFPPGDYEVRLYYGWAGTTGSGGGQCEVIGRQAFTVTP